MKDREPCALLMGWRDGWVPRVPQSLDDPEIAAILAPYRERSAARVAKREEKRRARLEAASLQSVSRP